MNKKTFFIIIGILIVILVFILIIKPKNNNLEKPLTENQWQPISLSQEAQNNLSAAQELNTYTHPGYHFSFSYPKDWKVSSFSEGEGEVVLAQDAEKKSGFQIFISTFDETETVLTKERILQDIPSMTIDDPKEITLEDGIKALIFLGSDPSLGKTREIWFIFKGNLYQIMASANIDDLMAKIMTTWKFE